jgi:hypothetical protein
MGRRLTTTLVLTVLLACSGLGICWRSAVGDTHSCCTDATLASQPRSCASAVALETPAPLPAPPALPVSYTPEDLAASRPVPRGPAFGDESRPLVLRI